jgi:hypothetical protein
MTPMIEEPEAPVAADSPSTPAPIRLEEAAAIPPPKHDVRLDHSRQAVGMTSTQAVGAIKRPFVKARRTGTLDARFRAACRLRSAKRPRPSLRHGRPQDLRFTVRGASATQRRHMWPRGATATPPGRAAIRRSSATPAPSAGAAVFGDQVDGERA